MHGIMVLTEVKLRVVAALVSVLELVARVAEGAGGVEGVGDVVVRPAAAVAVDFEADGVADPGAGAGGDPFDDGVFPVGFVVRVFFEVDAVVDALWLVSRTS